MEQQEEKFSLPVFVLLLISGGVVDLISIVVPGIGSLFILVTRGAFHFMGINTALANIATGVGGAGEAIPALSALPLCSGYVIAVYIEDKVEKVLPGPLKQTLNKLPLGGKGIGDLAKVAGMMKGGDLPAVGRIAKAQKPGVPTSITGQQPKPVFGAPMQEQGLADQTTQVPENVQESLVSPPQTFGPEQEQPTLTPGRLEEQAPEEPRAVAEQPQTVGQPAEITQTEALLMSESAPSGVEPPTLAPGSSEKFAALTTEYSADDIELAAGGPEPGIPPAIKIKIPAKQEGRMSVSAWREAKEASGYPDEWRKDGYEFGVQPLDRIGFHRHMEFNNDVLEATEKLNRRIEKINQESGKQYPHLTPGLLASTVLQEGMASDTYQEKPGGPKIFQYSSKRRKSTYGAGADVLGTERQNLIRQGYLENDFFNDAVEIERIQNEKGEPVINLELPYNKIIEGSGALLVQKRNRIIDAVGIDEWNKYSEDEQNWLTYAAYNWGEGNVIALMKDKKVRYAQMGFKKGTEDKLEVLKYKEIPIESYTRHLNGEPVGRVQSVQEFIRKEHGRNRTYTIRVLVDQYKMTPEGLLETDQDGNLIPTGEKVEVKKAAKISDFHYNASQVVVSTKTSNRFFDWYQRQLGQSSQSAAVQER